MKEGLTTMATKVNEKLFSAVKILCENGATLEETANFMKISKWTVSMIKRAETFEEYKNIIIASKGNTKKKEEPDKNQVVEYRQNVTIQATHYMMTELQKTNEYLKAISSKLAYIVDELCGTKKEEA